uniref:DDE Tnp4 domain-containing protein n=1 Tax=Salarias fasciatus TaxID=181472 RepID=A0A672HFQ1_SALFA
CDTSLAVPFLCVFLLFVLQRRRRRPTTWAFSRSSDWWDVIVPGFTTAQWALNFRVSEDTFQHLCEKVRPAVEKQNTTFRACVPLRKRVAVALWKLATNSEYRSISHLFGVSITTVCRCVQDFCDAARELLVLELIKSPDLHTLQEMSAYFHSRWGLPQCVGAIDGSYIPIIAPQDFHCDYFNRKGWHSIILQVVVDGRGLFWSVSAGIPGSVHDARVLRLSSFQELVDHGSLFPTRTRDIGGVDVGYYILGDSAYPLQRWLMKPFLDTRRLTAGQQLLNRKISRARVVVENAFGRLKGRWRCLLKRNNSDLTLVKSMVLACCALHNLCESHGEDFNTEWNLTVQAGAAAEPEVTLGQIADEDGKDVREALMLHLSS